MHNITTFVAVALLLSGYSFKYKTLDREVEIKKEAFNLKEILEGFWKR